MIRLLNAYSPLKRFKSLVLFEHIKKKTKKEKDNILPMCFELELRRNRIVVLNRKKTSGLSLKVF
jgi:hypothetical protein